MKQFKMIFSDKKRRKEAIKNIVIVSLILLTVLFFVLVWKNQNINSDSIKDRSATVEEVFQNPSDIDDENITKAFWEYTSPEYMVVNKEGNRDILYSSTENYAKLSAPAMHIIKEMYGSVVSQSVLNDAEMWNKMLSVNSVLMHFPADIHPAFQMQFLGIDESPITENITAFADILIVTGLPEQENVIIYIKEAKTERIVRFETKLSVKALNDAINSMEYVVDKNYVFGYELKLDSFSGNSTMISSMLTIPLVNIETPVLEARVPDNFTNKLREVGQNQISRNVIEIFGCDPNTIRSYTDINNSRILLGTNRRIALSSDGVIEFVGNGVENGIDITGGTVQTADNSLYVAISGTVKTILGMLEITGTDIKNADYEIKLTTMSCSDDYQEEIRLNFDYYINGLIMEYIDEPGAHAIEAVISRGRLIYFKMELKNFVKTGETVSNEQMITAIDAYCSRNQDAENIYIYDSYLYYGYTENNRNMRTRWEVN